MHAYANPAHERRAAEIARELWPNAYIGTGVEVLCSDAIEQGRTNPGPMYVDYSGARDLVRQSSDSTTG